jgi:hypothetical protein
MRADPATTGQFGGGREGEAHMAIAPRGAATAARVDCRDQRRRGRRRVVVAVTNPRRFSRAGLGIIGVVETIVYRLSTRLDALAAAHMLRGRGHSADLPRPSVADDGHTLEVRVNRNASGRVRLMVETMFPDATIYPDPPRTAEEV